MKIHTIPLGADHCYQLEGERSVFIDGASPNQSRALAKGMAELGVVTSKVAVVILTHAHWGTYRFAACIGRTNRRRVRR